MAQSWRSGPRGRSASAARPVDTPALERIALRYVERYATTRAKLAAYLVRKVRERGWAEETPPAIESLVERFAGLGYVDDAAFAGARAASLTRRGYGLRRVSASLRAAGIDSADSGDAEAAAREGAWQAALTFARRRKIGPFSSAVPDRAGREKAIGAMLRAGHDIGVARKIVMLEPGSVPESDQG